MRPEFPVEILRLLRTNSNPTVEDLRIHCLLRDGEIDAELPQLEDRGFLALKEGKLLVTSANKVELAVLAVQLGAKLEKVSKLLTWQEFESIIEYALATNGYHTKKHLVLALNGNRTEIDVIAAKGNIVLAIDCKHYTRGWIQHSLKKAARIQIERVRLLLDNKNLLRVEQALHQKYENEIFLIPIVVALSESPVKIYERVPIIPVLKFATFLNDLHGLLGSFAFVINKTTS